MNYVRSLISSKVVKKKNCIVRKLATLRRLLIIATFTLTCYHTVSCDPIIHPKNSTTEKRPDMLCNVGDEHECVCNRSLGNLDEKHLPCDNFLEVKKLFVVCIKMRRVNLNAVLYTNESYQQYFRRRIASILSSYCETQPHECPGTNFAKKPKSKEEHPADSNGKNGNMHSSALLEDEDYETEFTLQNVVILKVTFDERNRTNVYFVVTKSTTVGLLNNAVTMDPTKVKYILSAQIAPLSRVLGGIRIVEVKLAELKKPRPPYSNKSLIIVVTVVGLAFSSCCLIAIIKLFRDQRKKSATLQNPAEEQDRRPSKNYGSCTDKFLPIYDMQNGKTKSKSLNNSARSKKRKSTTCSLKNTYTAIETERIENEALNNTEDYKRSMKNLFKCDASQLPRESCEFHNKEVEESQWKPSTSEEDYVVYNYAKNGNAQNPAIEIEVKRVVENVPSVVLISSQSDAFLLETNNNDKKTDGYSYDIKTLGAPAPFERPLSRRGSRESSPEQGVEECGSSREDTPLPLGDELAHLSHKKKKKNAAASVAKSAAADTYMSSSESDEDSKVYHPLENYASDSNDEGILATSKVEDNGFARRQFSASGKADGDAMNNSEAQMLDRHHYERLQESPIPPQILSNADIC